MDLATLARRASKGQAFDVMFDNEWHQWTREEIIADESKGGLYVIEWFASKSFPGEVWVTCA